MNIEVIIALVLTLIGGAGGWYFGGLHPKAELAAYKARVATENVKMANDAIAANNEVHAKEAATNANNAKIVDDLQGQLATATAASGDLVKRLRLAELAAATASRAVQAGGSGSGVAPAPGRPPSPSVVDERLTAYDAACQRDDIRFSKLVAEITPQLD